MTRTGHAKLESEDMAEVQNAIRGHKDTVKGKSALRLRTFSSHHQRFDSALGRNGTVHSSEGGIDGY